MRIGFIGLGAMGRNMAHNLIQAGFDTTVWNRSPEPLQELVTAGATGASTPADCASSDVLITMLTDGSALAELLATHDLLAAMRRETVHINMATVSVSDAHDLAQRHHAAGRAYVAAPVLGRPDVAKAAKLNILAAGQHTAVATARPVLETLGTKLWPIGEAPERANVVKLAANYMLISAVESMGEAAALTAAHGIEPADFLDIVTGSVFNAPAYSAYAPAMAHRDYNNPEGFRLALGAKDLDLALSEARERGVPLPVGGALRERLTRALAVGSGERDLSALAEASRADARLDEREG